MPALWKARCTPAASEQRHAEDTQQLETSACNAAVLQGRLSVAETLAAARLEEELQIQNWGLVEGGHDIDIADAAARISAAALFSRLTSSSRQH
jgi:chaperone required for assembly of F1-ATPase